MEEKSVGFFTIFGTGIGPCLSEASLAWVSASTEDALDPSQTTKLPGLGVKKSRHALSVAAD